LMALVGTVVALGMMLTALVALPVISPSAGAAVADGLRAVLGPQPVAELESLSFKIQDVWNRARYQWSGGQPQVAWENPEPQPEPTPTPAARDMSNTRDMPVAAGSIRQALERGIVDAPPAIPGGWQTFGPSVSGGPVMARGIVRPDPGRPYAQASLVRIDLSRTQLSVVPGTDEPVAAKGVPKFSRPGTIPTGEQTSRNLLAAFNGGFKAVHGGYGMMANGVTILPPLDNIATLAMYRDGTMRLGAWGRDITLTVDLVAYRQNCPLLVDAGAINATVNDGSRKEWGYTVKNLDTTWRSGVGISRDGRFLIYAVGPSLTVESLARALQQGGAYNAMQLDINGFYTRFVTYRPADPKSRYPVTADKLLNAMSASSTQFLTPYDRDFFYLTAR
jgi:hypothetical protein